ncbi:hypothetical protein AMECASPLE_033731 [Ameca splendens]|uniref:Ig-like domain-containing protein n=1 Tax=Ameca splendens TaxID=208324 RepID=A0ABV0XVQ6_9TELE
MLLFVCFLLAGSFCHSTGIRNQTVFLNTNASLPCSHAHGDVTWSRYRNMKRKTLVSITKGVVDIPDKRFGLQADGALLIRNVDFSDESMYLCNLKQEVYLKVISDSNEQIPKDGPGDRAAPGKDEPVVRLESEQKEAAAEIQHSSDSWKIPVGVVLGAALLLLMFLALRVWSSKRAEIRNSKENVSEVVYEEIQDTDQLQDSELECRYYSTIMDGANSSTPSEPHLYSSVNRLRVEGWSRVAQNPQ